MRFHVVGLGSIGTLVAFHLRRVLPPQHSITLVSRQRRQTRLLQSRYNAVSVEDQGVVMSRGGFRYETASGARGYWSKPNAGRVGSGRPADPLTEQLRASRQLKPARLRPPLQCVVLATKANATLNAVRALRHRIDSRTTLVLLQNGMGVYERLCEEVFPRRARRPQFVLTANTHGAWTKDTALVVHAGKGALEFAVVPDPRGRRDFEKSFDGSNGRNEDCRGSLADVAYASKNRSTRQFLTLRNTLSALSALELNTRWLPIADLEVAMRKKLVVNSVINPLTAIMGCKNRDVFERPQAFRILQQVCTEAEAVFTAQLRAEVKEWEEQQRLQDTEANIQVEAAPADAVVQYQAMSAHVAQEHRSSLPDRTQLSSEEVEPSSPADQAAPLVVEDESQGTDDLEPSYSNLERKDNLNTSLLSFRLSDEPRLPTALRRPALIAECLRVADKTGDNFSSMLSDVRQGRSTEIDYMNGYLVTLGARLGVPTPTTDMLISLVKERRPLPLGPLPVASTRPKIRWEAATVPTPTPLRSPPPP